MRSERYRIGPFEFDPATGELSHSERTGPDAVHRLAPQPGRLLALLVERRGELVTRDEIRRRIWPDVAVEFDASLHYCIRQIRSALGDTSDEPSYIENLPRRGYRINGVDPISETATTPANDDKRSDERARSIRSGVAIGVSALVAVTAMIYWLDERESDAAALVAEASAVKRIGILPFEPPDDDAAWGHPGPIAEHVLEQLTLQAGTRAEVVGPTTTAAFTEGPSAHRTLAGEYQLDYLIHGRFIHDDSGYRMLAELIRARDGAHVWVRSYVDLEHHASIGREITAAMLAELESPRE